MQLVKTKMADGRVLGLIEAYLKQEVMDTATSWTPEQGSPQGAVLSPLLSNIYLDPLDHVMAQNGYEMVRYADDFVVLCRSEQEARAALERVREWTEQAGLRLHPDKTRLVDASQKDGFDFLGYHFAMGRRWPSYKSQGKLRDAVRDQTRRNNGHSLCEIIATVNRSLQGWFEYFKHGRRTAFAGLDSWVRMRLRSILRRRDKRRGCGRGRDHQRWPNKFFETQGLFSLLAAQGALRQPRRG
jgi:RNA-directed DNA polymerase